MALQRINELDPATGASGDNDLRIRSADGRVDSRELAIQVQNGHVFLRGYLPNAERHQILLRILTDVMGPQNIDDRVSLGHTLWGREKNERPRAVRKFTGNIVDSVKELPILLPTVRFSRKTIHPFFAKI